MSRPDALYLLLGPEEGEKEAFIKRLVDRIAKKIGEQPEVYRFYAFEHALAEVLAMLRNGSLFARHRIVLLRGVEEIRRKAEIEMLAEYCASPAPDTTLVLVSEEVGRIDERLKKLVPRDSQQIFWELFDNQKVGWIVGFFRRRGLEIDPEAADYLLEMVENNTKSLRDICEKLVLYLGGAVERAEGDRRRARIGLQDIEELLYHSKEENVFTLFERMSLRDFAASLEVLDKILLSRETDAVQLLGGLLSQYRKLMALKVLTEQRYSPSEAMARIGIRGKRNQRLYADAVRHYSLAELQSIIRLVAVYDRRVREIKSSLHSCVLQLFVYFAVVNGGGGASLPNP